MDNTNICTVRDYGKDGKFVEVNGRDVPCVRSIKGEPVGNGSPLITVTLRFDVAQFNEVQGDATLEVFQRAQAAKRVDNSWRKRLGRWIAGA